MILQATQFLLACVGASFYGKAGEFYTTVPALEACQSKHVSMFVAWMGNASRVAYDTGPQVRTLLGYNDS